jgi:surface antigen
MRRVVLGALAAGALTTMLHAPTPAAAAGWTSPSQQILAQAAELQRAQADMANTQATVGRLDVEVAAAQQRLDAAIQKAEEDRVREQELQRRVGVAARQEYQTQGTQVAAVIQAHSISQVWTTIAESKVVAERQRSLVAELDALRRADEALRDRTRTEHDGLVTQRDQAMAHLHSLLDQVSGLSAAISAAGQVLSGTVGPIPPNRLSQTTGADGQCTYYAEQAWVTYSDQSSPRLTGDGGFVVQNLAAAMGRPVESEPKPGSLVSWLPPLMSSYGHVGYVASVQRDSSGALLGYTVWEMNYTGAFQTDARHVAWTGPSSQIQFISPPTPVDPILIEAQKLVHPS